jgi:hypothetical protein
VNNPAAFPYGPNYGISLRDYFAGLYLAGTSGQSFTREQASKLLASSQSKSIFEAVSKQAYEIADQMLAHRDGNMKLGPAVRVVDSESEFKALLLKLQSLSPEKYASLSTLACGYKDGGISLTYSAYLGRIGLREIHIRAESSEALILKAEKAIGIQRAEVVHGGEN